MRQTPLFIVLSSLLFFSVFLPGQRFIPHKSSPLHLWGLPNTKGPAASLWRALVTGDDSGFDRLDKKTYYRLGLGHLFTPSGVHLSSLGPLLRIPGLVLLIAILSALRPELLALSRVSLVRMIPKARTQFSIFASIFIIEGFLWSWSHHSISWICSWLFLGLNLFAPRREAPLWFMLAQLILCWVLSQPLSLFSPIANLVAGIVMAILFPITLILSFFPFITIHQFHLSALNLFHKSVLWFDGIHQFIPALQPHIGHILLLLCWILTVGENRKWLALGCLLLSSPLNYTKVLSPSLSRWEVVPFTNAIYLGEGRFSDGVKCKWKEGLRCRPPNRGRHKKRTKKLSLKRSTSQKFSLRGSHT